VLNLLKRLQRDLQLTILLVTHDLRVVNFFCDRVAVFYRGHLVELGPKRDLIRSPRHPYTAALLSSAPAAQVGSRAAPLRGELADEDVTQVGCPFAARCALRERLGNPSLCKTHRPPLHNIEADRLAACHFASDGIGLDQVQPVAPEQAKVAG
jgi:peptide/nickel transport system ATP-binding protein